MLSGAILAGGKGTFTRADKDFYATPTESVKALFDNYEISGDSFYEPCVGQGHIAEVIKEYFPQAKLYVSDIVDRGYPNTIIRDFLKDSGNVTVEWVITNPPYKYAKEFIENSLKIVNKGVAMFLKIQFLEGQSRKDWLQKSPLKYVYVFSKRQSPLWNGQKINPKTGKKWTSTMCFAWYIWEKYYKGEPVIRWI